MTCYVSPCQIDSGGNCGICGVKNFGRNQTTPTFCFPSTFGPPMGCICPPTSEKTCESPICPRKNHSQA